MNDTVHKKRDYSFLALLCVLFNVLYVFTCQLKYPFGSDLFLYGSLVVLISMTFLVGKIHITIQTSLFFFMVVSSFIGVIYTTMRNEGLREAVLFTLFFIIFVLGREHTYLIKLFLKFVYWMSVVAMFTAVFQRLFPIAINFFFSIIVKEDSFEVLMRSYSIDNAYAGILAYTPYTAFFSAIVFGQSILNLLKDKSCKTLNSKLANVILILISILVIVLSSKRSLFVSIIIALFVTLFCKYRKNNFIVKTLFISIAMLVALIVLYNSNELFARFLDRFIKNDNFLTGRDTIYSNLWNDFLNGNIFIGRGTGATYKIAEHGAHNIYLEILYDHGLLLSSPFYAFLLYNYSKSIKSKCYISIYVQSIFLIYGLAGNPLYSNMLMLVYVFYVLYAIVERSEIDECRDSHIPQCT